MLWQAGILITVLILVILVFVTLPKPSTMFVLSAQAESVDMRVVHVDAARLTLAAAMVEGKEECRKGVQVQVDGDGVVTYARQTNGPLYISIRGPFSWTDEDEGDHPGAPDTRFVIDPASVTCKPPRWIRLPANGRMTVGVEPSIPASADDLVLLKGELQLLNRSVGELFGIDLDFGPFAANAMYVAGEIPIPFGSRIDNALNLQRRPAIWSGTVTVDMEPAGEPAMQVELATNAQSVNLWAPAIFEPAATDWTSDETGPHPGLLPDVISLSHGSRLASDPNLRWIYGLIAAFTAIFGFAMKFWSGKG